MLPVAPKTSCKVTGLGSKSATGRLGTFWTLDQPSVTSIQMMRIAVTSHEDHEAMRGQVMSSHVKSPSQVALLGLLSLQSWQTASVAWPNLAKLSGVPLSSYGETLHIFEGRHGGRAVEWHQKAARKKMSTEVQLLVISYGRIIIWN